MTHSATDRILSDRALLEEAAAWRLRLFGDEEPAVGDAEAFERWLSASPRHQQAFDRTGDAWDLFEPHASTAEVIRARRDALEYARRAQRNRWSDGLTRRGGFRIAASLAAAAVLGAVTWPIIDGVDVYRTRLGERREVTLADGSRIALDSDSRVRVHYTERARDLTLEKGQARFDVAHNPARPFSVTAGERRVVATGTAFNIELLGKRVNVTLIEGSVVVATLARPQPLATPKPAKATPLKAGEQLVATAGSPRDFVAPAKLDDATAWQHGKIVLDNLPLAEAAMRVNRYADRKVVVADAGAAAMSVSGVFQAGDPETFARAMAQYLDLQADFGDRQIVLSRTVSR